MTLPLYNVGGLASGLDTNSIVSQLMDLERIPVIQMQQRRAAYQAKNAAWDKIATRVQALREKIGALDTPSDWQRLSSAVSSNPDAVSVAVTGGATHTNLSFTVDRLAAAHQVATSGTFTSSTDLVGAGTFTLTTSSGTHDITTDASTTVGDLATQISALDAGVTASLLFVDTDQARLVITAGSTGDDSVFTAAGDQASLGGFDVVEAGVDSQLTLGSGAGALTVERSTNTVDDLVEGLTLTLTGTTASPVAITVNRDVDGALEAIKAVVDEFNATIAELDTATRTATEAGAAAGPLSADSTARSLELDLRSAISGLVSGLDGPYKTAGSIGISLTRDGTLSLDEDKLREALETDFDAVQDLFARTSTATDSRVSVSLAGSSELDGTHDVTITQAASRAGVTGIKYLAPDPDESFTITSGALVASVSVATNATIDEAVDSITSALEAAGITTLSVSILAVAGGNAIVIEEDRYGGSFDFTVSANSFGLDGTHVGTDVAGTIGGIAATGSGRSLTGTGDLDGLVLSISATQDEVAAAGGSLGLGTVSIVSGLGATLDEYLGLVEDTGGIIDRARDRWDAQIEVTNDRIEQLEDRLDMREALLRRQFTALESTMARLLALSNSMAASFAGLSQGGLS